MVKHIKKIALLLSAGAMLVFASCSGLANGSVSGNDSPSNGELSIYLGGDGTYARFLAPDTLTTAGIDHYTISGESVYNGYTLAAVTYDDSSDPSKNDLETNKAKLTVQLDDWNFTLRAYDSSGNLLLKGTTLCQMKSSGATTVAFNISSYEVETLGSYKITVKYGGGNWEDDTYSFKWALYNTVTGECLTTTGGAGGAAQTVDVITADDIATTGHEVAATGVTPGTYLFGVKLFNGSKELAFASDLLLIEPGRETEKDFNIGNIIDSIPAAPTDFKVQRILNSQDAAGDFYDVRLIWTDASTNETEFKLCLKEFSDTHTTEWPVYASNFDLATDNAIKVYSAGTILDLQSGDIRYVAGSLYAGSSELVLRLPTGRLFDFQILAVNDIGSSATVLRAKDTTDLTTGDALVASGNGRSSAITTTVTSLVGGRVIGYDVAAAAPYYHVNLVRIVYALNGGTLTTGLNQSYAGTALIEYEVYKLNTATEVTDNSKIKDKDDTGCKAIYLPLKEIKAKDSGSYPTLVKDNKTDFTKWQTTVGAADVETVFNVKAYKNIVVDAVYGQTEGTVTVNGITIEKLPAEDAARISATYGTDSSGSTNSADAKNKTITIGRGGAAQYVTVGIAAKSANGTTFVKWHLYINGSLYKEMDANEATAISFPTFSTSKLKAGGNEIMVVGVTANGGKASSKFVITIGN